MLLVAIDTATPAVTAGVVSLDQDGVRVLGERVTIDPRAHGELITPRVMDAVRDARVALRDADAIVCGNGPGPYTGLRAGMATAGALGHGLGVPVYPVGSLDAIAAGVSCDEPFLVVTDARRREVYWASYDGRVAPEPRVQRPEDVRTDCRVAAGHGAGLYADTLGLRVIEPAYPGPRGLALAASEDVLAGRRPAELTPLYLRQPHAATPGGRKRVST